MSRCFAIALVVLLASVLSSEVPSAVEAKEQESAGRSSVVTEQQRESIVQTIEQLVTDICLESLTGLDHSQIIVSMLLSQRLRIEVKIRFPDNLFVRLSQHLTKTLICKHEATI